MLKPLRFVSALAGAVTAANVLLGYMTTPEFVAPDILVGIILIAAALCPSPLWAWRGLVFGNAYALGVFSVALAARMQPGGVFNPGLVAIIIVVAASLAVLLTMRSDIR